MSSSTSSGPSSHGGGANRVKQTEQETHLFRMRAITDKNAHLTQASEMIDTRTLILYYNTLDCKISVAYNVITCTFSHFVWCYQSQRCSAMADFDDSLCTL